MVGKGFGKNAIRLARAVFIRLFHVQYARHEQSMHPRLEGSDLGDQIVPRHARHREVRQKQIESRRIGLEPFQGLLGVCHRHDLIAEIRQHGLQGRKHHRIVIHEQDPFVPGREGPGDVHDRRGDRGHQRQEEAEGGARAEFGFHLDSKAPAPSLPLGLWL